MRTGKKRLFVNILLYAVFAFYILLLLLILFRRFQGSRSVNLVPLRSILAFITGTDLDSGRAVPLDPAFVRGLALSNILGNIVIFIPLGVYITLFNKDKTLWKNALWAALASLAAEAVQVAFKLGTGDIDDIILNGLGGLLGILLCRGIYRLCKQDGFRARCAVAVMAPIVGVISFAVLVLLN